MTLPAWRGRGYVRAALTKAAALVAGWLWAREGLVISAGEGASSYQKLGWRVADAPVICEQPRGRDTLPEEVAVVVRCHGDTTWSNGAIDLPGVPW